MRRLLLIPVAAALGAAACASGRCPESHPAVQRHAAHGLINPILDLDESFRFRELPSLRPHIEAYVRKATAPGTGVREIAIYFRDLNNGPWFGVDEGAAFAPASLLKVPVMMAILKQAEEEPKLLETRISDSDPSSSRDQMIAPKKHVEPGRPYTVRELLELMIASSDNRAYDLLAAFLDRKVFSRVFEDLNVPLVDLDARDANLTVKQYATFFRILYNASYLSRGMSQKALEILSRSDFREGIVAGVAPGTVVANKFGEREMAGETLVQLHDCGIVYYPQRPYVLCVMTRGDSIKRLAPAIREASALIYREVSGRE
jgi:beta-lactamase class A